MKAIFSRATWLRTTALLAVAVAVSLGVFLQSRYPLLFLIPPLVFVVATRIGFAGVVLFVPILAVIGLVCTQMGLGPFALVPAVSGPERLALLVAFLAATLLLGRVVANVAAAGARALAELKAERNQLVDSEAMLRLLTDHSSDIVARVGRDGRWRFVSPAAQRLFGKPPAQLLGCRTLDFVHPDDRLGMLDRIARLQVGVEEPERPSFRIVRPDGTVAWVEASTQVLVDPATGAPDGYVSMLRDVTARVAAETALHESSERMRLLLDGVADHAVYMLDPEGCVVSWNAGAERIKGYRAEEIIGRYFDVFFTPEDRAAGEPYRLLTRARERGHVEGEAWRQRKDGSRFLVRAALTAIRDQTGVLRGFAKVAHDLTGRQIEEAQRAIMVEAAPNGMLIVDEAGLITLANAQADRIFGYPEGGLVGLSLDALMPEMQQAEHASLRTSFDRGSGAGPAEDRQFEGRRQDGSTVAVQVLLRAVRTAQGSIAVVSVIDVTERLRQQAEREAAEARARAEAADTNAQLEQLAHFLILARDTAEQASQAKSRFLTGVTHELRTPLNGILGYAQLLRLEGGLTPAQDARVAAMLGAGEHLLGMINAVLDLSQIESDKLELLPAPFDLAGLARACLDVVRPAAEAKALELGLEIDPAAPVRLVADPTRLRQVLVNLVGNAVKFTRTGHVTLRVLPGQAEAGARIEVADTGPGIAGDDRTRLFGEFERAQSAGAIEGSGLGLAITSRLVQRMGGSIGHEDNPGGGSVFWIEMPPGAAADADSRPEAAPADAAPCLRILVVDDVAMNRDIAGSFLQHAGHDVVSVDSGPAAIEAVATTDFDVVLMDVRMPGMDGLEATRRIRALGGPRAAVPIIALTAQAFTDQLATCREAGMDSHLSKPFTQPALVAAVQRAAAGPVPGPDPVGAPVFGADLPLLDDATFQRTAECLAPDALSSCLKILADRGEDLLRRLRAPTAEPPEHDRIAEVAHTLAGSAGMFGLARLAAAARRFEHALDTASPAASAIAHDLDTALQASLAELQSMHQAVS